MKNNSSQRIADNFWKLPSGRLDGGFENILENVVKLARKKQPKGIPQIMVRKFSFIAVKGRYPRPFGFSRRPEIFVVFRNGTALRHILHISYRNRSSNFLLPFGNSNFSLIVFHSPSNVIDFKWQALQNVQPNSGSNVAASTQSWVHDEGNRDSCFSGGKKKAN